MIIGGGDAKFVESNCLNETYCKHEFNFQEKRSRPLTVDDNISESAKIKWCDSHLLKYFEFIILLTIVLVWLSRQSWMSPSFISLNLGPEWVPDLLEGIADWLLEAGEDGGLAPGVPGADEEGVDTEFSELSVLAVAMLVQFSKHLI